MSAATTYINGLLYDARCFRCLPEATHFEIQTYILSVIAGGSTDPAVLVNQARGLAALSWQSLTEIKVYLLATLAGFDTTPNNLVTGAKCYPCIPDGMFTEVQTYLLAQDPAGPGITDPNALAQAAKAFQSLDAHDLLQIQVMLLALMAGLTVDASALIQAAKCMECFPWTILIAVEVATLDFLEPVPGGSARTGLPPPDPPPPPPGGTPPGRGGGVPGGCTDTIANLTPVITAHYVAGAITTIDILVPRTCCKKSSFELFGSNSADMSGAVLVTGGSNPNKTVNWTMTGIDVSLAGFSFYAAESVCVGGLTSPFSNIVSAFDGSTQANDWANRVVINGGAMPSANSISACKTFVEALMAAGAWSKMVSVNMIAPDSMIAALTPLVVGPGLDPWQGVNGQNLTVDGIQNNAGNGYIDTGVRPSSNAYPAFSYGLIAYNFDAFTAVGQYSIGVNSYALGHTAAGEWELDLTFPDLQLFVAGAVNWRGYSSGQRVSNNDLRCFRANSTTPWAQVGFDATVVVDRRAVAFTFFVLAIDGSGFPGSDTVMRHSFFAITKGLTATEDHAVYNAVQALRTAFGGGFI